MDVDLVLGVDSFSLDRALEVSNKFNVSNLAGAFIGSCGKMPRIFCARLNLEKRKSGAVDMAVAYALIVLDS